MATPGIPSPLLSKNDILIGVGPIQVIGVGLSLVKMLIIGICLWMLLHSLWLPHCFEIFIHVNGIFDSPIRKLVKVDALAVDRTEVVRIIRQIVLSSNVLTNRAKEVSGSLSSAS